MSKKIWCNQSPETIFASGRQDSTGSPFCLNCSCWPSLGSASHCLRLQLGFPCGILWRFLTAGIMSGKRVFFPKMCSSSLVVEFHWPGFPTWPSLIQSQLWGIEYSDRWNLSHMITLGVGGGGKSEFCPHFQDWEGVGVLQSEIRLPLSKEGKMNVGQAELTAALHVGLCRFSSWSCFFFLPCLQKSLHFAMWYYLPRTLHLCLRKINTQPICRLYLP